MALTACQALIRVFGPGPVGMQVQPAFALSSGQPGGEVQERRTAAVSAPRRVVRPGESQVPEAGEQVRGQGDDLGQREVDRPVPRRPLTQPEGLGLLDVVFDMDVAAVAGVESGDLPDRRVGGDDLVASRPVRSATKVS